MANESQVIDARIIFYTVMNSYSWNITLSPFVGLSCKEGVSREREHSVEGYTQPSYTYQMDFEQIKEVSLIEELYCMH